MVYCRLWEINFSETKFSPHKSIVDLKMIWLLTFFLHPNIIVLHLHIPPKNTNIPLNDKWEKIKISSTFIWFTALHPVQYLLFTFVETLLAVLTTSTPTLAVWGSSGGPPGAWARWTRKSRGCGACERDFGGANKLMHGGGVLEKLEKVVASITQSLVLVLPQISTSWKRIGTSSEAKHHQRVSNFESC